MTGTGRVPQEATYAHELSDNIFPRETQHTCVLTPNRVLTTDQRVDQRTDTIQVHFGKPMNFTGVTYKSMGEQK